MKIYLNSLNSLSLDYLKEVIVVASNVSRGLVKHRLQV